MFLQAKNLASLSSVSHGFFSRKGGISEGIYHSLNCGYGTKDSLKNVHDNRKAVASVLGTDANNLLSLNQVHGNKVITVTSGWDLSGQPKADAMVTNTPRIALGILTADCVPVLFGDKKKPVIGAAHAGWKGALAGVIEETVKVMAALGAKPENIAAAIGPAIAQASYEVDPAFRSNWTDKSSDNDKYFIPSKNSGRFLFDLKRFVYDTLIKSGISDINMLENDTYLEEDDFFSYRRATHHLEGDYGRQVSAIIIK